MTQSVNLCQEKRGREGGRKYEAVSDRRLGDQKKRRNDDASRRGRTGEDSWQVQIKYIKDYYMYKYVQETTRRANVIKEVMLSC